MNKYQLVVKKITQAEKGSTVVVLVDSLSKTAEFVNELKLILGESGIFNYVLNGPRQLIAFIGLGVELKFMTIDTFNILPTPFFTEEEMKDTNNYILNTKDISKYVILDLEKAEGELELTSPTNLEQLSWVLEVLRVENKLSGKAPTYELQGLPKDTQLDISN